MSVYPHIQDKMSTPSCPYKLYFNCNTYRNISRLNPGFSHCKNRTEYSPADHQLSVWTAVLPGCCMLMALILSMSVCWSVQGLTNTDVKALKRDVPLTVLSGY